MKAFVEAQVSSGGYSSASEYIRELVRTEQKRQARERLEQQLLEAIDSGDPIEVTPQMREELRREIRARAASRRTANAR
jgi:antitoxin ParD1/3/4